jgi:hypothetical protein
MAVTQMSRSSLRNFKKLSNMWSLPVAVAVVANGLVVAVPVVTVPVFLVSLPVGVLRRRALTLLRMALLIR